MAGELTRIFSDVHYGERASRVRRLEQLHPLVQDADAYVLNGDTLDTRSGPRPDHTERVRNEVLEWQRNRTSPLTLLTGNHDPDVSTHHWTQLANGTVFVTHGDVLFDDIAPWGHDVREIRRHLRAALRQAEGRPLAQFSFPDRMALWRTITRALPQRHQSEQNLLKYAWHFAADTLWPPTRFLQIFRAWSHEPKLAASLIGRHAPEARFFVLGHTHRPSIRRLPRGGPIVINTGSFTTPLGGYTVEVDSRVLRVRQIVDVRGEFRPGETVAEFPLAT